MWKTLTNLATNYRNPYMPREELNALQTSRLKRIIDHARATVPYYRKILTSKPLPGENSEGPIDTSAIPITRKKDLMKLDRKMIISSAYEDCAIINVRTGGSTGTPFEISLDSDLLGHRTASRHRTYISNGYKFQDKIANLQFLPVETNEILTRLGFLRKYTVPFEFSVEKQINVLQSIKPAVLEGYPSRLAQVGKELSRRGITDLNPKLIISNSEKLDSVARSQIRAGFGVDPVNLYDSWEFGIVAWECQRHQGLHVNEDLLMVEVVKEDGMAAEPGESGELVITDLFNTAMPFIRYGTGDFAIRRETQCTCGRTFFLLDDILGRVAERCFFSDGTYAMGTTAMNALISHDPLFSEILEYQFVQNRKGELDLMLVTERGFTKDREEHLRRQILQIFSLDRLTINNVDHIQRTGAGKFRPFVSNVTRPEEVTFEETDARA